MPGVRRSLFFSFSQAYVGTGLAFISVMVLARLLTPEEIGVYVLGMAFIGMIEVFREFGVRQYIVQESELTEEKLRAAFGVSLFIGLFMGATVLFMADRVAIFYAEPGIANVLTILSLNFFIVPFNIVMLSQLTREMRFDTLFWINTLATLIGVSVGISLALLGFSFMSMAWASIANTVAALMLCICLNPRGLIIVPSFRHWRSVVSYGSYALAGSGLRQLANMSPDLVVGRVLGVAPVAQLSRANGLIQIYYRVVMRGIVQVALANWAKRVREGGDLKADYNRAIEYLTALAWPFFIVLALMAHPVVNLLYGDQWDQAVDVVRILCAIGLFLPFIHLVPGFLMATGRVKQMFYLSALTVPTTIGAVVVGSLHGLEAVAVGLVIANGINACFHHFAMNRAIDITWSDMVGASRKSFLIAIATAVPATATVAAFGLTPTPFLQPLLIGLVGTMAVWVAMVGVTHHPFWCEVVSLFGIMRLKTGRFICALRATQ